MTGKVGFRRIAERFIYSGLLIGLAASAMTALSLALQARAGSFWGYCLAIGAGTAALYTFHWHTALRRMPAALRTDRDEALDRNAGLIRLALAGWSILSAVTGYLFLTQARITWMLPALAVGVAYVLPITMSGKRLRDLGWAKIIWVSLAWAWLTAFVPAYLLTGLPLRNSWVQMAERTCFILAIALPFEIRDQATDRRAGLLNIASRLTDRNIVRLGMTLMCAACFFALLNGFHFLNPAYALVPALLWLPYRQLLRTARQRTDDIYFSGLTDGLLVAAWPLYLLLDTFI